VGTLGEAKDKRIVHLFRWKSYLHWILCFSPLLTPLLFFSHPFMSHTVPTPPTLGDSAVNTLYVSGIAFSAALGSYLFGFDIGGGYECAIQAGRAARGRPLRIGW
jgi:hypothetical protein